MPMPSGRNQPVHALDAANGQVGEYLALDLVDQGAGRPAIAAGREIGARRRRRPRENPRF
jgi:hypothetical protein